MADIQDINNGASGLICDWILASIATGIVLLRLYAKSAVVKRLGWDDLLMSISLVHLPPRHGLQ